MDRPLDWGRGSFFEWGTAVLLVALLVPTLYCLVVSIPYVTTGSLESYAAVASGDMTLPYLPTTAEDIHIVMPENVSAGEPFKVRITLKDGRAPSRELFLSIENGSALISYRLWDRWEVIGDNESWTGWVQVPGFQAPGRSNISISYVQGADRTEVQIGGIEVRPHHGYPSLVPRLGPFLSFSERLVFDVVGDGMSGVDFLLKDSEGGMLPLEEGPDRTRVLTEVQGLHPGWNWLEMFRLMEGGFEDGLGSFLLLMPGGGPDPSSHPELSFDLAFDGFDELYQQRTGPETFQAREGVRLYSDSIYIADLEFNGSTLSPISLKDEEQGRWVPYPSFRLNIGDKRYLMMSSGKSSGYRGTVITPNGGGPWTLSLLLDRPGNHSTVLEGAVELAESELPAIDLEPDPFDMEDVGGGHYILSISEGWEINARRDLEVPAIIFGDRDLEAVKQRDRSSVIEYDIELPEDADRSGEVLHVEARSEYRFANYLTVLLPFLPVLFYLPIKMLGYVNIAWFCILALIILICSMALIAQDLPPLRKFLSRKGKGDPGFGPRAVPTTMRTFLAGLFFSVATVLLFEAIEQPTPVPGILSSDVPIWIRMFFLGQASVWEEVAGRCLLIGAPMFLIAMFKRRGWSSLRAFIGGTGEFGPAPLVLILISSTLFALAHLGWGPWKMLPTFVTGLLFGYLFQRIGLHAAIVMHFFFDYTGFLLDLTSFGPYLLDAVYISAMLFGGLFLADILFLGRGWTKSGSIITRIPPWVFLGLHSALCIIMGLLVLVRSGPGLWGWMFLSVPFVSLFAFLLSKGGALHNRNIARVMVVISSLMSLALAPLGMAWVLSSAERD